MDHLESPDADLVRAWIAGDEGAYERIVRRYTPMVFNRCRRSLGAADADDATQAVFLVLARRRERAADAPVLAAWLMAVAGNVVRNAWRDRQRRQRAESAAPAPTVRAEEPIMPDAREHLDACLAELPARERDAVVLHHLAGRTLAEVAAETGVHLNTVKYRIANGLERLRGLLGRRGVAIGAVALLACLHAEASAAVPVEVLEHVRGVHPTSASGRVLDWSRQGRPVRNAMIAAGLLLAGGAAVVLALLPGGSQPSAVPQSPATIPVPHGGATVAPAASPLAAIDPERARTWILLRANDGARTAKRIGELPEMALVPAGQIDWLDAMASLREAVVLIDQDSLLAGDERIAAYRRQQEMATLARSERNLRKQEMLRTTLAGASDRPSKKGSGGGIPAIQGWIACAGGDAPLIRRLRATLDAADPPPGTHRIPGGWACAVAGGESSIRIEDARIVIGRPATGAEPAAAVSAAARVPQAPDSELEFRCLLDPGRPGSAPLTVAAGQLAITPDGLRLQAIMEGWGQTEPGPALDPACFSRVPSSAILAGGVAMRPDDQRGPGLWRGLMVSLLQPIEAQGKRLPPAAHAALEAFGIAIDRADGILLAWLEPGAPIPMLTVELDMPAEAGQAVIRATGQPIQDDGGVAVLAGPIMFSMKWQQGRLIATTSPGGIEAISRDGGFGSHEEVRRALAALPAGPIGSCVLLRPRATLDLAMPFGVMLKPDLQRPLVAYRQRLSEAKAFGYFAGSTDAHGYRIEAGGVLALVGCAILASQAADPAHQVRIAN